MGATIMTMIIQMYHGAAIMTIFVSNYFLSNQVREEDIVNKFGFCEKYSIEASHSGIPCVR